MKIPPPFSQYLHHPWVEERLAQLSPRQQLAQLIHIPIWPERGDSHLAEVQALVENFGVGGCIFFQGNPPQLAHFEQCLQTASEIPLLTSIDGEWGLAMRLRETRAFPYALTLGAVQDTGLIEKVGNAIGYQCRELGLHVNFAPVADLNNEPQNPVIGYRAFGDQATTVATQSEAFARGQQNAGVLAVAKHFPGHGATRQDSHHDLPILHRTKAEMIAYEWVPFQHLIETGVGGMMSAHLHLPALDNRTNRPASLSRQIVADTLRAKLGFEGLIFTDALNMQGVARNFSPAARCVEALRAGNDILLYVEEVGVCLNAMERALREELLSEESIRASVRRQLAAKYWAIEQKISPSDRDGAARDALIERVAQAALTWVGKKAAPLLSFESPFAAVCFGEDPAIFLGELEAEAKSSFWLPPDHTSADLEKVWRATRAYDTLVVGVFADEMRQPHTYGLTPAMIAGIKRFLHVENAILVAGMNPYGLPLFIANLGSRGIVITYQNGPAFQRSAAQFLKGEGSAPGRLPVLIPGVPQ